MNLEFVVNFQLTFIILKHTTFTLRLKCYNISNTLLLYLVNILLVSRHRTHYVIVQS